MKYWLLLFFFSSMPLSAAAKRNPTMCDYGFLPPPTAESECGKLYLSGDLCLLRSPSEGQVFGTEYVEGEDLESIGGVKRLYFPTKYDFGFRIVAGYSLPGDQWAASATWFWFASEQLARREDGGFGSSRKGGSFFLVGLNTVAPATNSDIPLSSSAKWGLKLNQIDFDASRDFLIGPAWTLKPVIGVRLIHFNEHVDYHSIVNSDPLTDYLHSRLKGAFWGCGPLIGCDNFVDLGCGLGGILNYRLSLLVSKQDQKQTLSAPFAIDPFDLSAVDFRNEELSLKAALDFAVGLEWRMPMNQDLHFFFIRAAFENHLIFRAVEYPYLNSDGTYLPSYNRQPHDFALFGFSLAFGFTI